LEQAMSGMIQSGVKRLVAYDDPRCFGGRMRARRSRPLVELIRRVHAERGNVRIIDVGGTRRYWRILPESLLGDCDVHITIVNLPGTPAPDAEEPRFTHAFGDGCDLSEWPDAAFDIAHSNSVIEHVGDWDHVVRFAAEVRRVARYYFLQTPHFWFPVEPHCMVPLFHWLPMSWRVSLVRRCNLGNWTRQPDVDRAVRTVESARLLDRAMFEGLFGDDATIRTERFFGLPKSMVAVRDQAPAETADAA
jgi:hypothetical protein